jgi:hypothetical protein
MFPKTLATMFLVVLCTFANGQEKNFKVFKAWFGGGYAISGGYGARGGFLMFAEPAVRLTDQVLLGVRLEIAGVQKGYKDEVTLFDTEVSYTGSTSLHIQYYLSDKSVRPFLGLGMGRFSVSTYGGSPTKGTVDSFDFYEKVNEVKFGLVTRAGVDVGHFSFSLDLNLLGPTTLRNEFNSNKLQVRNSYVGVRFGGVFGGGHKGL